MELGNSIVLRRAEAHRIEEAERLRHTRERLRVPGLEIGNPDAVGVCSDDEILFFRVTLTIDVNIKNGPELTT